MKHALPDCVAGMLAARVRAEAARLGVPMAVAVVDAEGGLQWFARMDGTLPVSTGLAIDKAYTAAALRMPTDEVGRLAQPGAPLYGIGNSHGGRIVLFGGGLPLRLGDRVVGGIGVSGGSVEQDVAAARPAAALLGEMERQAKRLGRLRAEAPAVLLPSLIDALKAALPDDESRSDAVLGGVALALS